MDPITREEMFLAKWAGDYTGEVPHPITRAEQYLSCIIGELDAGDLPEPLTRQEMYFAYLCGVSQRIPDPITRVEQYYYAICNGDPSPFDPITRREMYLSALCGGEDVNSWAYISKAVRRGAAPELYPVGHEFAVNDSDTGRTLTWVVCDHDKHTAANRSLKHTMTLRLKNIYSNAGGGYRSLPFDAPEALYYCADALPAGTYHFGWDYSTGSVTSGTFQFATTRDIPQGGQIVIGTNSSSLAITSCKISTYASVGDAEAIESGIAITEGNDGSGLGTVHDSYSTTREINCGGRILYGSNNYAQSAAREWLNSGDASGTVWTPTNIFDRPPSWAASYNGFMRGLDSDFLDAVQPAVIQCRTNSVFEVPSLDGTVYAPGLVYSLVDSFFFLSRPEMYGTLDDEAYKDGEQLALFAGLSNSERIERDATGAARSSWLRSPVAYNAGSERIVYTDGSLSYGGPLLAYGVVPACIIA